MQPNQGLKNNIIQFTLLVFLNFLVGAVVGIERSSFFNFAETKFHIQEGSFLVSFLIAFGLSKAIANLFTSKILNYKSKKWLLIFGWLITIPGVLLLLFANVWWHVILANIFIGLNQGFCWSSNVLLKIDLVGNKQRGLAMGFNEFSGYLAVGILSFISGYIILNFNYDILFYTLLIIVLSGLILSVFFVKDTKHFLKQESMMSSEPKIKSLFKQLTLKHPQLSPITINGFTNNLIDGAYWLMLPIILVKQNYSIEKIGLLVSVYPIVWAVSQLFTGKLGDTFCRKQLITIGMVLQILGLVFTAYSTISAILLGSVFIGIGTAFVYPNFLTEVSAVLHPNQRAQGLSYFRFWRDMGYVGGAIIISLLLPVLSPTAILITIAFLTTATTAYAEIKMCCVLKYFWRTKMC
jgi:MFS family permease